MKPTHHYAVRACITAAMAAVLLYLAVTTGAGTGANDRTETPMHEQAVTNALTDLATRLAIDVDKIQVVEDTAVTWPDSSLGCPRKGMAYTQQLVNGYRLLLRVGEQRYHYHAGKDRQFFLCQVPKAPYRDEATAPPDPSI